MSARKSLADLADYDLRAQIMWISTIAQNNTLGVGREQDWSTHLIANELSALYDTPHGATPVNHHGILDARGQREGPRSVSRDTPLRYSASGPAR